MHQNRRNFRVAIQREPIALMIIPLFRLSASIAKWPSLRDQVVKRGEIKGDFLHIQDNIYYGVAKECGIDHLEAKKLATGQAKIVTATKMAAGFAATMAKTAIAVTMGADAFCTPEEIKTRVNICAGCQFFIQSEERCSECGCPRMPKLVDKWKVRSAACPKHKWPGA
jgi:hypothetical protein